MHKLTRSDAASAEELRAALISGTFVALLSVAPKRDIWRLGRKVLALLARPGSILPTIGEDSIAGLLVVRPIGVLTLPIRRVDFGGFLTALRIKVFDGDG